METGPIVIEHRKFPKIAISSFFFSTSFSHGSSQIFFQMILKTIGCFNWNFHGDTELTTDPKVQPAMLKGATQTHGLNGSVSFNWLVLTLAILG